MWEMLTSSPSVTLAVNCKTELYNNLSVVNFFQPNTLHVSLQWRYVFIYFYLPSKFTDISAIIDY